jgi:biotin synthase
MNVMPSTIRVSLGSTDLLNYKKLNYDFEIKTVYLLIPGRCNFDCKYCTQGRSSKSEEKFLSRVVWPEYNLEETLERVILNKEKIKRVCIQTVNNRFLREYLFKILEKLKDKVIISISINTFDFSYIKELFSLKVDRIGLPIDVADKNLYKKLRGGDFDLKLNFILKVSEEFKGKISTHIIVGLGERDIDILNLYKIFIEKGIKVALFSFTPIKGTQLENFPPPSLIRYRKIQIATKLLENGYSIEDFKFDEENNLLKLPYINLDILKKLDPFKTRGCEYCTRPYYNERPKGDLYNYPYDLNESEFQKEYEILIENKVI